MTTITLRNREIKKVLSNAFGRDKVSVRGSRGTGYGYVHVDIDWTPLDMKQADEMTALCFKLLAAAKVDLGRAYTDDTCQYTCSKCHISFNPARYYQTMRLSDGKLSVRDDRYDAEWRVVEG